jgi:hypothetical protein
VARTDKNIRPDLHNASFDQTQNFIIQAENEPHVAAILGVYAWDSTAHTHLCEFTPSYWMLNLGHIVRLTDEAEAKLSDREREAIYSAYETVYDDNGGCYMHVHEVEGIVEKIKVAPFRYDHLGHPPTTLDDYDSEAQFEKAIEEMLWESYNTGSTKIS